MMVVLLLLSFKRTELLVKASCVASSVVFRLLSLVRRKYCFTNLTVQQGERREGGRGGGTEREGGRQIGRGRETAGPKTNISSGWRPKTWGSEERILASVENLLGFPMLLVVVF